MARTMKEDGKAFRTRIEYKTIHGTTTIFEGPYATAASAKTRIIWAERIHKNRLVEAVVEEAVTNWQPIT